MPDNFFRGFILSLFCLSGPASADDLKRLTVDFEVATEVVFERYQTYRTGASWSDFLADNPHLTGFERETQVPVSTPYFVPRKYCSVTFLDGTQQEVSVSYTTISKEQNQIETVPINVLFKFYSRNFEIFGKAEALLSEFLECNPHIERATVSDTVYWEEDELPLWSVDFLDR